MLPSRLSHGKPSPSLLVPTHLLLPQTHPLNGPGFLSDQPAKPSATAHESTCCRPFSLYSKWIRCTIQLTAWDLSSASVKASLRAWSTAATLACIFQTDPAVGCPWPSPPPSAGQEGAVPPPCSHRCGLG